MISKTKVAIIIPSWNSARDLPALLQSLKKQDKTLARIEVVLVDNHSSDNSVAVAKKFYPRVVVIQNPQNLGIAEGNNIGLSHAFKTGNDYAIVLNADTTVDPHLVSNLLQAATRHPNCILSPKIYFAPGKEYYPERYLPSERGKVIWYAGGVIDWRNVYGLNRGVDEVDHGHYDREQETNLATGCCMLIPKDIFEKIGGFNPKYYLYYEDTEYSIKVKKIGGQVWYIPKAVLWHINAGSSGVGSGLQDYYITRNRLYFGIKYAAFRIKIALIRESVHLLFIGRTWQKRAVLDFYLGRQGMGSYTP
jgi:hypothetical protein